MCLYFMECIWQFSTNYCFFFNLHFPIRAQSVLAKPINTHLQRKVGNPYPLYNVFVCTCLPYGDSVLCDLSESEY